VRLVLAHGSSPQRSRLSQAGAMAVVGTIFEVDAAHSGRLVANLLHSYLSSGTRDRRGPWVTSALVNRVYLGLQRPELLRGSRDALTLEATPCREFDAAAFCSSSPGAPVIEGWDRYLVGGCLSFGTAGIYGCFHKGLPRRGAKSTAVLLSGSLNICYRDFRRRLSFRVPAVRASPRMCCATNLQAVDPYSGWTL
jgi:hypothetical protein